MRKLKVAIHLHRLLQEKMEGLCRYCVETLKSSVKYMQAKE
jgi:vacuolar-type H+-ATPase subunit D/Vma8